MKRERPILFSAPMVRAILAGEKTQTRRIVKRQPPPTHDRFAWMRPGVAGWTADPPPANRWHEARSPYGVPGDTLWVRETWYCDDYTAPSFERARAGYVGEPPPDEKIIEEWLDAMYYRADAERTGKVCELIPECECDGRSPWKPAIHMPRWASRLSLSVTELRVERLHDITEADAIAEGVDAVPVGDVPRQATLCRRDDFAQLWNIINGERAPWASNPWVWVVEFARTPGTSGAEGGGRP